MAASSVAGKVLEAIAAHLAAVPSITWGTPPSAIWYPDFDAATLKNGGLTAFVMVPSKEESEPTRRADANSPELSIHISVLKPFSDGIFDEGDAVVAAAEAVAGSIWRERISGAGIKATCVEIEYDPVISASMAKEKNLWLSYLKCSVSVSIG